MTIDLTNYPELAEALRQYARDNSNPGKQLTSEAAAIEILTYFLLNLKG